MNSDLEQRMMDPQKRYVADLKGWELPRLQEREEKFVEEVLSKARIPYFNSENLGDALYDRLCGELRSLAAIAVNETIEYWLRGLADGNNGASPELCVELPCLHRGDPVPPLTLAYCVPNEDGSRTEINRTTLEAVLAEWLASSSSHVVSSVQRGQLVVNALRHLARTMEERLHAQRDGLHADPSG
jgi:hypothetical protein